VRLSCLARNGRSPGEESLAAAIAVQAIEAQPPFGQIKPLRGKVLACAEQHLGDVPASDRLTQEGPRFRRRRRKPGVQKGGPIVTKQTGDSACTDAHRISFGRRDHPLQQKRAGGPRYRDRHRRPDFSVMPAERRQSCLVTRSWSLPRSVAEWG
jgi:hypothetical protein